MTRAPRVAIVGGGITGAFAAYFLARAGAAATVVERGEIAGQASGNSAGGLNPLHGPGIAGPLGELALASLRLHLDHAEAIQRLSGAGAGPRAVPRIHVAMEPRDEAPLASLKERHDATAAFSARWMTAAELRRAEPRIGADALGGLWTEGSRQVDAGAYARAVHAAAQRLGARTVRAEARGLRHRDGRVRALLLDRGEHPCDAVVIASGPWCEGPARWLGTALAVEPVKGELLLVEARALAAEIGWRELGAYAAGPDRLWLGGTEDRHGLDARPSAAGREHILAGIGRLLPGLGTAPRVLRHVAGLRPVTADGLPIVGIPAGWENVCLAVGSGRKGILLSAAVGLAAAQLLTDGSTPLPIGACRPDRAALRTPVGG